MADFLTAAANDLLTDMCYRDQRSILTESHNRDIVRELQSQGLMYTDDNGDGPGREGWYDLNTAGVATRNRLGVVGLGLQGMDLNSACRDDLLAAAEHFAKRAAQDIPGERGYLAALARMRRALGQI